MRAIQQIIENLSQQEGFDTVILTDATGLPLASSVDMPAAESFAAVVADMLRASAGVGTRLGMEGMSEVLLIAEDAKRGLLCRKFQANGRELVLALIIYPNHAYWPATTQAIQDIKRTWQTRA
ncbi:MAG: roadblock/LC7 domain-containing protein [Anaerolineae bacterium]|nr:roadblock/LC7 domain-containing protein [Anaerolineae bacterium]